LKRALKGSFLFTKRPFFANIKVWKKLYRFVKERVLYFNPQKFMEAWEAFMIMAH